MIALFSRLANASLFLLMLLSASPLQAKDLHQSLNKPGTPIEIQKYLVPGKINLVQFYADWCPQCQESAPGLEALKGQMKNWAIHFVNIGDFESKVASQYEIHFIPQLLVYDEKGKLIERGQKAEAWLEQEIVRPHK